MPFPTSHFPLPPSALLMCRPTHYTIAYEINPWMSLKRQTNHRRALAQWTRLYALLTKTLRVLVQLIGAQRGVPDLVFTANAGLVARPPTNRIGGGAGRGFIRSNFRPPQRPREE